MSAFLCFRGRLAGAMPRAVLMILLVAVQPLHIDAEENKPSVHLEGVSIKRLDWKDRTAGIELSLSINNPGPAFKLKDLSYRFKLNGRQAGQGKCEREIEVGGHSSTPVNLPCAMDLSELPGIAWAIAAGGFDVHYELETEFSVPSFPLFAPRMKSSIAGDLSLVASVSGWTAKIKERLSRE